MMVMLPQININGTSPTELLDNYCACGAALRNARDVLAKYGPHGRDYQFDPSKYPIARAENVARLAELEAMIADYDALAMHASDAVNERESRRKR